MQCPPGKNVATGQTIYSIQIKFGTVIAIKLLLVTKGMCKPGICVYLVFSIVKYQLTPGGGCKNT